MKTFLLGLSVLAALVTSRLPVVAAGSLTFTEGNTGGATNLAVSIISAYGNPYQRGTPIINFLSVTSDLASASIRLYDSGPAFRVNATSAAATNIVYLTNWVAASNAVVVLRHVASDTYERLVTLNPLTTNSLRFTTPTASAVAAGDQIYLQTLAATIAVGVGAKEIIASEGFWAGEPGRPVLVEVAGTTSARINVLFGRFREQ